MIFFNLVRSLVLLVLAILSFVGLVSFWGLTMGVLFQIYTPHTVLFSESVKPVLLLFAAWVPYFIIGFYLFSTFVKEKPEVVL